MSDRDAIVSDVVVVLDARWSDQPKTDEAVQALRQAGLEVREVDEERSVIEGTIDHEKVEALKNLESVDYVRVVFTYVADYPAGHPGDRQPA